jgi:hypothetical protein
MQLDFFARRAHYLDHLAPVYKALPDHTRGIFTVPAELESYARQELGPAIISIYDGHTPVGSDPILVASYGDIHRAARTDRKIIHMEHGTGHAFGKAPYPNGRKGSRDEVDLFLAPNEYTAKLIRSVRKTPVEVVGTPKMDPWYFPRFFENPGNYNFIHQMYKFSPDRPPVIAIAFHWGDRQSNPPESGSALEHYREILPELNRRYTLIGHGHPLAADVHQKEFEQLGIEWVGDFREVLRRADLYLNDLSSTLYEFLVTGKPVIVLNAPWFRKDKHWGIRFWDYSDVGPNVESPDALFETIDRTLRHYGSVCAQERRQAVRDLYPYIGHSAQRAAEVLVNYLEKLEGMKESV